MAAKPIAIIAGVGSGTGASVARRFAQAYPVALLARSTQSYEPLVKEINSSGGKAYGFSTDVSDPESVRKSFEDIKKQMGDTAAAAVFNASGPFARTPFLETTLEAAQKSWDVSLRGAFIFSQASIPMLLAATSTSQHPPTLIFTGATASVKSNAMMSGFSTAKHAVKALSQSIAKEFGPKGVHVAHAVIDGVIDIPRSKEFMKDAGPDAKISPEGIADTYFYVHTQPRSAFMNEIDIRPFGEKW